MTLTIDLPPELEKAVRQHAARSGQDVAATGINDEEFVRSFEEVREEVWQQKQGKGP